METEDNADGSRQKRMDEKKEKRKEHSYEHNSIRKRSVLLRRKTEKTVNFVLKKENY